MIRGFYNRLFVYCLMLVVLQIPLLHNWTVMGVAFPFPYIGFIILFPHTISRSWLMILAFLVGLLIDVFSNTPGMHAALSVLVAYLRMNWLGIFADLADEDLDISVGFLGILRMIFYCLGLIFVHHVLLFILENEGISGFLVLLNKSFWSAILSLVLVLMATFVAVRPKKRA